MDHVWTCRCCGKQYDTLPMSFGTPVPDPWLAIPEAERDTRAQLSSDTCIIDGAYFFVLGWLEIPVAGCQDRFVWNVWVSVSPQSFERIGELWEVDIRDQEPTFFGWLCSELSIYPSTFKLKTHVHLRNHGTRPFIELEPTDHPLAVEQREGCIASKKLPRRCSSTSKTDRANPLPRRTTRTGPGRAWAPAGRGA